MVILNQEASDDTINEASLNPLLALFRTGFLGAAHGWGGKSCPFPKICRTYPTMMKLSTITRYLKKI